MSLNRFRSVVLFSCIGVFSLISVAGCASDVSKSNKLDQDTHARTAQIVKGTQSAQAQIAAADQSVQSASTQAANPPQTDALLAGAHQHLIAAQGDLAPIVSATAAIEHNSTQAAALTADAQKKLTAERDHWLGYKTRVALCIFIPLSVLAAFVVFAIQTNGAGPILSTVGEIGVGILGALFSAIKSIGTFMFHVFTLGASFFANKVNQHYDAAQGASQPHEIASPANEKSWAKYYAARNAAKLEAVKAPVVNDECQIVGHVEMVSAPVSPQTNSAISPGDADQRIHQDA